ncbi:uncharacterized protein B0H18DRAFT_1123563 [Fomitopsis serialis]|uniref:uncharacterized protein n=1 Tax=Fomitopsis serialis TaxID=139415 RepID=UPI002008BA8A|nr:uncharacterized protein B0H18DRAFT_1123563 [Neoantrodia serialis]KAH9917472.1 hypothetical protein B0H18DRAFT_1123563 [Neoantrodia serialis]
MQPGAPPAAHGATPAPPGGWTLVEGDSFYHIVDGMGLDQINAWVVSASERPTLVVFAFGSSPGDPGRWQRILDMRDALRIRYGVLEAEITPSTPIHPDVLENSGPYYYLVQNITIEQRDAMITDRVLSTTAISLYFTPLQFGPPNLAGTWSDPECFGATTPAGIAGAIANALSRPDLARDIQGIIRTDIEAGGRWRHVTVAVAFRALLDSIRVTILDYRTQGGVLTPLVLLYCESPTANPVEWSGFRTLLSLQRLGTPLTGHPTWQTEPHKPSEAAREAAEEADEAEAGADAGTDMGEVAESRDLTLADDPYFLICMYPHDYYARITPPAFDSEYAPSFAINCTN